MIFQQMKLGTSVTPRCDVISTGEFISEIILIIRGHLQGQKVNFKSSKRKHNFLQVTLGTCVIPLFS